MLDVALSHGEQAALEVPVLRTVRDRVRVRSQSCPPSLAGWTPEPR